MQIECGVIPAAGKSSRMGYLSSILPKCLLPLPNGKPIIHMAVEHLLGIGVAKIFLIVNYKMNLIKEYIKNSVFSREFDCEYLYQRELKGLADAIHRTRKGIHQPFAVILPDEVFITKSFRNLVDLFFEKQAMIVEGVVTEKDQRVLKQTCCVELDGEKRIARIEEKPVTPFSSIRGTGFYICGQEVFDYIEKTPVSKIRNELEWTDTIKLAAERKHAYGDFIRGIHINVNQVDDHFKAWNIMKSRNKEE
jgi:bifunctional UDP-N-acetylglucosamine pyrophosphorylase/glucosamine-1-phosphate N-acetyltransferase